MGLSNAPGELLVDELVAHEYGISVGDQVPFTAFRKGQNASGTPKGARFGLTVVGIIREPSQYLFPGAGVFLSPGTADRYGAAVERIGNSHVRLADPERDMARLRAGREPGVREGHAGPRPPLGRAPRGHRHLGRAARADAARHRGGDRRDRLRRPGARPVRGDRRRRRARAARARLHPVGPDRSAGVLPHLLSAAVAAAGRARRRARPLAAVPDRLRPHGRPERRRPRRLDGDGAGPRAARLPRRRRRGRRGVAAERPARTATRRGRPTG